MKGTKGLCVCVCVCDTLATPGQPAEAQPAQLVQGPPGDGGCHLGQVRQTLGVSLVGCKP